MGLAGGPKVGQKDEGGKVNYEEKYSTKYGAALSSKSDFDISVWIESIGGLSKNKNIYGIGSTHTCDSVETLVSTNARPSQVIDEDTLNALIEERLAKEREEAAARENAICEEAHRIAEESKE